MKTDRPHDQFRLAWTGRTTSWDVPVSGRRAVVRAPRARRETLQTLTIHDRRASRRAA